MSKSDISLTRLYETIMKADHVVFQQLVDARLSSATVAERSGRHANVLSGMSAACLLAPRTLSTETQVLEVLIPLDVLPVCNRNVTTWSTIMSAPTGTGTTFQDRFGVTCAMSLFLNISSIVNGVTSGPVGDADTTASEEPRYTTISFHGLEAIVPVDHGIVHLRRSGIEKRLQNMEI
jgi:hypothetical protein